jgi:hypothetical protein
MRFVWFLIFMNTAILAGDLGKNEPYGICAGAHIHAKDEKEITQPDALQTNNQYTCKTLQPSFIDDPIEYSGKVIYAGIRSVPHALSLTLGIGCLFSRNRDLTYMLMRASGVAWALYYFKIGMDDDYAHSDSPPFMQSVYFNVFVYSGLSYLSCFPYFTHFGALHIFYDTSRHLHQTLTATKPLKRSHNHKTNENSEK